MIISCMHKTQRKMGRWIGKSIFFGEYIISIFRKFCLNIECFVCNAHDFSHIFLMLLIQISLCTPLLKFCRIIHTILRDSQRIMWSTDFNVSCLYQHVYIPMLSGLFLHFMPGHMYYAKFVLSALCQIRKLLKVGEIVTPCKYN